jgi:hypothetical protein
MQRAFRGKGMNLGDTGRDVQNLAGFDGSYYLLCTQ